MTIDEAIQRENKIAKENQKIVDTQIVFDNVSLSQLYCDDTEVIEEHLSNYRKCAEYRKNLAEWLEELKALKNGLNIKCDSLNEALEKGRKIGYNKAIDDVESEFLKCDKVHYNLQDILCVINKLKAGVENEQSI